MSATRSIRDNRHYNAAAELINQSRELNEFIQTTNDKELLRDAKILQKYAAYTHEFDQSWFKGIKKWKDMSWDKERFTTVYD